MGVGSVRCLLVLAALGIGREPVMSDEKLETFKRRVDFDSVPGLDAKDGVNADWHRLPGVLAAELKDLRLFLHDTFPVKAGLAMANWDWKRGERQASVSVYVFGDGPLGARDQFLQLATNTSRVESAFVRGPEDLGELSAEYMSRSSEDLIWVFRNVCVRISNHSTGVAILPIARRVQAFMKGHLVQNLAAHVPKVAHIDLSPNPARLGDTVILKVRMANQASGGQYLTDFNQGTSDLLQVIKEDGLVATFEAHESGRAQIEVLIVDPKTLLSPKAGVVFDVLPVR
jgi:hypothetical protein